MNNASDEAEIVTDKSNGNSSVAFPPFPQPPPLPLASLIVGLVTCVTGMCANAVVFMVLVFARRHYGSNVNTLLANQSAMDLLACIFATTAFALSFPGASQDYLAFGEVGKNLVCFLLRNRVLAIVCTNADKIGLVVITLERYFKVVHAVLHRKYYRSWMSPVGVAVPWISALVTFVTPSLVSTRDIVPGQCPMMGFWPNEASEKAYAWFDFSWHYGLPVAIFAYCYARIVHVIIRQKKVVKIRTITVAPRDQSVGPLQLQEPRAGGTRTGAKLSRIQLNVVQTMIAVIVCFIVCWTPGSLANIVQVITMRRLPVEMFDVFGALGFINLCLNPLIYAARYDMFKKSVRRMLMIRRENIVSTIGPGTI